MKRQFSILLALALVMMSLVGCQSPAGTTPSAESDEKKLASEQILRLSILSDPRDIDPQTSVDSNGGVVTGNCFEPLVKYNAAGEIVPGLAVSWEVSADEKMYTFKLRDAKWSDGSSITAEDVAFSWMRAIDPVTASANAFKFFVIKNAQEFTTGTVTDPALVGIKVVDDKTIQVELVRPTPYFMTLLMNGCYRPVKKAQVEELKDKFGKGPDSMVYSGPFILDSWTNEQEIKLKKNVNYYEADKVNLQEVVYAIVADENLPMTMYESGELDSMLLDSVYLDKYRGSKELTTQLINNLTYISFNCKDAFFSNLNLRKAFSMTVDRDTYTKTVLNNGAVSLRGFVPYDFPGKSDGKSFRETNGDLIVDISKDKEGVTKDAVALLEKGLNELGKSKEDLSKHMSILTWDPEGKKLAQVVQQSWKESFGLDVTIEPLTLAVVIDRMFAGDYTLLVMGYGSAYFDAMSYLEMYTSDFPYQTAFWISKDYDAAIKKAFDSAGDERMEALLQAEKLFIEGLPVAPVYQRASNYLDKPYVKGIVRSAVVGEDFTYAYIQAH